MAKFAIVFLVVCVFGFSSALFHGHGHGYSSDHSASISVEPHHQVHHVEHIDHTEVYSSLANGVFDFIAKLVRAKVEVLLWLKKALIQLLIRGLSYLRFHLVHNKDFVHGIIHTFAELIKVLLTNQPHFAVGHVSRIISEAEHEYIPRYGGHY